MKAKRSVVLCILDGFGLAPEGPGNAVTQAKTPRIDALFSEYPQTSLECAGRAVGLPEGFMGNSEVGHMNIGAGRVVYQDMTRIDIAIENNELETNATLIDLMEKTQARGGSLHLMGLLSDGGVHSHIEHVKALLQMCKNKGLRSVHLHAFLDGRDTPPTSGKGYVEQILGAMNDIGIGDVATVTGRFWAMDRDKRWERVEKAYIALTSSQGETAPDALSAVAASYDRDENDEFVKPTIILDESGAPVGPIRDGDGVFFFNFRADRARELTRAFIDESFEAFDRVTRPDLAGYATMTEYESSFGVPVAFGPQTIVNSLGEMVSQAGMRQLRIAETEKYAHVTYFFSCGRESEFPGEERVLIPSPRDVATYDLKPQMSACTVADALVERLESRELDFVVVNFANPDMVGHTGILAAAIQAIETVDGCVGRVVDTVLEQDGILIITADHGNAEVMMTPDGAPVTSHSTNNVPFVLVDPARKSATLETGKLGDIAPTVLHLLELEQPGDMTGKNLIVSSNQG
ncbi:2,3-bisphosphoglycerate-independent phosphoglycerate mutase [Desulfovibrio inopinatus]|uniref:2,3-bisphosphoglycerate-independent phosphoglycerate mutase n=1 Tax=Desulfovibrio inopinatus TaxID=102109 RepID=UPI0004144876|nr:2,3-bisphosphoglycerate-independent phosphoglycerate mutase [Desulfovibrio inopinatus]